MAPIHSFPEILVMDHYDEEATGVWRRQRVSNMVSLFNDKVPQVPPNHTGTTLRFFHNRHLEFKLLGELLSANPPSA